MLSLISKVTQIVKYNTRDPSSPKRPTFWTWARQGVRNRIRGMFHSLVGHVMSLVLNSVMEKHFWRTQHVRSGKPLSHQASLLGLKGSICYKRLAFSSLWVRPGLNPFGLDTRYKSRITQTYINIKIRQPNQWPIIVQDYY